MTKPVALQRDDLQRLYHGEGQSVRAIARLYGCTDTTVCNYLRRYDIPARPARVKAGTFTWSAEARARMSEQRRGEGNPRWGQQLSEETRRKIAEKAQGRHHSDLARRAMSDNRMGTGNSFWGRRHTPQARAIIGAAQSGRSHSAEQRDRQRMAMQGKRLSAEQCRKMSVALKGKPRPNGRGERSARFGKPPLHGKCVRYERSNGDAVTLRSSYEARAVAALDALEISWVYEPQRFRLQDRTYVPDLHLPTLGMFYEVKGWFHARHQETVRQFRAMFPEHPLVVLTLPALEQLEAAAKDRRGEK